MIDYETLKEKAENVFLVKCPFCMDVGIIIKRISGKDKRDNTRQIECYTCKARSPVCTNELEVKMMWVQLFYKIHDRWM